MIYQGKLSVLDSNTNFVPADLLVLPCIIKLKLYKDIIRKFIIERLLSSDRGIGLPPNICERVIAKSVRFHLS